MGLKIHDIVGSIFEQVHFQLAYYPTIGSEHHRVESIAKRSQVHSLCSEFDFNNSLK